MSILTVGAGETYASLAAAVNASASGDTIQIQAGLYINDFTTILHPLTIQGVGGLAHFIATISPPNGKAIMTVDANLTVDHLEFSGAQVGDGNGAGIRYEAGNLVVHNSWFHDNQDGLLGAPSPGGTISIDHSEFDHNGTGDGATHNIYIGNIAQVSITDSYFHDVDAGHEIKSRAQITIVTGNRIQDGPDLSASFSIDLPDGGQSIVTGNTIEKGALAQNWTFVHFGGEANPSYLNSSLLLSGNTLVNDMQFAQAPYVLLNQTAPSGSFPAIVSDNIIYGLNPDQLALGPADSSGNSFLTLPGPALDTSHPWDVPEPASAGLMLTMLAAAAIRRVRRRGRP
jgi:hypothetical protein